jgi:DNA-directed RNA polymerase alpha subunit
MDLNYDTLIKIVEDYGQFDKSRHEEIAQTIIVSWERLSFRQHRETDLTSRQMLASMRMGARLDEESALDLLNYVKRRIKSVSRATKKESKSILLRETELSTRTINTLEKTGLKTLGDVCRLTEKEILEIKGIGPKGREELRQILGSHGGVGFSRRSWKSNG